MSTFSYTARLDDGALERGTIEAKDVQAARTALRAMETDVVEIEEVSGDFSVTSPVISIPATASGRGIAATLQPGRRYFPLASTLRLYAGWLLAWYIIIYGIGSYQFAGRIPSMVPFLEDLFLSQLIFGFAAAAFLFLLLSSIHRLWKGGVFKGVVLTVVGIVGVLVCAW